MVQKLTFCVSTQLMSENVEGVPPTGLTSSYFSPFLTTAQLRGQKYLTYESKTRRVLTFIIVSLGH